MMLLAKYRSMTCATDVRSPTHKYRLFLASLLLTCVYVISHVAEQSEILLVRLRDAAAVTRSGNGTVLTTGMIKLLSKTLAAYY